MGISSLFMYHQTIFLKVYYKTVLKVVSYL